MLVTPFPIVTQSSELQPENASLPMSVTLFGIVMLASEMQPENAEPPMLVTPSKMTTFVIDWYDENMDDRLRLQTHCGTVTSLIPLQSWNA